MTTLQIPITSHPLEVDLSALVPKTKMSDEQFYEFCQSNRDLRIERLATGEVIVMPPAFSDTGNRNFKIAQQVGNWADRDGTGETFDSSAGFTLPNGSTKSPDVSWIRLERWNQLSAEQKASFAPICPDFVVELRSSSDSLKRLQEKMEEYVENGVRLGLLVDRKNQTVHVYRLGQNPQILEKPKTVVCSPELSGFSLKMERIW
ncbi:MAG: Uma2 family endonuclease [Limnothrix sp.]